MISPLSVHWPAEWITFFLLFDGERRSRNKSPGCVLATKTRGMKKCMALCKDCAIMVVERLDCWPERPRSLADLPANAVGTVSRATIILGAHESVLIFF